MSSNDKYHDWEDQQGEGGEGGQQGGGQGGHVEFRDFLSTSEKMRDDLMSGDEKRRLLSVHKDLHEIRVKQQKDLRETRRDLKNGKIPLQTYRAGLGGGNGMSAQFKANPVLANKAQFSGIDRQVNALPTENNAETNKADRDELRLSLGYKPENTPKFNPKPHYP